MKIQYNNQLSLNNYQSKGSWFNQNMKTKPIQSQFKPKQTQFFGGFWRENFNFGPKIDDTKLNFLCKTKPIYINEQWSMSFQKIQKIQNKAKWFFENSIMGSWHLFQYQKAWSMVKKSGEKPKPESIMYQKNRKCCLSSTKKFGAVAL